MSGNDNNSSATTATHQNGSASSNYQNEDFHHTVGQDVSAWNYQQHSNVKCEANSATSSNDASSKSLGSLLASPVTTSQSTQSQHYFQLPSVNGINGLMNSLPVPITRQSSLPTTIIHSPMMDYHQANSAGLYSTFSSFLPSSNHFYSQTSAAFSRSNSIAPPPSLTRHRSMHSVPNSQNSYTMIPRSSTHHGDNLEISTGYQNMPGHPSHSYSNQSKMKQTGVGADVEPIHYDQKKIPQDSFEIEPLYFSFKRELADIPDANKVRGYEGIRSPSCEIGHIDKAFESLDKLIPEMDQDLFQPSELNSIPNPGYPSVHYVNSAQLMSSRSNSEFLPRGLFQTSLISNSKSLGLLSGLGSTTTVRQCRNLGTCKIAGCERRVRSKGFCKAHGGGRKCCIEGCNKSSQNGELCIGHGGGKKCRHEGCSKAAQSHGLCKAHGGGARCKFPDCTKSSQGGGLCRAHGGGKRCQAVGCQKGAQRGNFCATHGGFRNCKIDGCIRTDRGGGYCEIHRRGRLCKVKSCKKLARNREMCTMHIREERQEASPSEL